MPGSRTPRRVLVIGILLALQLAGLAAIFWQVRERLTAIGTDTLSDQVTARAAAFELALEVAVAQLIAEAEAEGVPQTTRATRLRLLEVSPEQQLALVEMPAADGHHAALTLDLGALIRSTISHVRLGETGSFWLMNSEGLLVFDVESQIIGSDVLALHTGYEELLAVDRRMMSEPAGVASYRFVQRESGRVLHKTAAWQRVEALGLDLVLALSVSTAELTGDLGRLGGVIIAMVIVSIIIVAVYLLRSARTVELRQARESESLRREVSEQRRDRRSLEAHYQTVIQSANDAILIADAETGLVTEANPQAERLLGRPRDRIIGMHQSQLHPADELDEVIESFASIPESPGNSLIRGFHAQHAAGHRIPIEISSSRFSIDGHLYGLGIFRDITEQLEAETRLKELVSEREDLLRETLHRTKNNLALVSSLLRMQRSLTDDPETVAAIATAEQRVAAMAELQQELYGHGEFREAALDSYLRRIASTIVAAFQRPDREIELRLELEPVNVDADRAVQLGLAVNELVTNSLKHAFDGRSHGTIVLTLRSDDSHFELAVCDDGVGMSDSDQSSSSRSLGMTIVTSTVARLGATIERTRNGGTRWLITGPLSARS